MSPMALPLVSWECPLSEGLCSGKACVLHTLRSATEWGTLPLQGSKRSLETSSSRTGKPLCGRSEAQSAVQQRIQRVGDPVGIGGRRPRVWSGEQG